jgi:hypothetical protein
MNIELGEYIMRELGDAVYQELEIDPSDYSRLPAYEFYDEVVTSCQALRPEIIDRFREEHEKRTYGTRMRKIPEPEPVSSDEIANDFSRALEIARDIAIHTPSYRLSLNDYANMRTYGEALLNFTKDRTPEEAEEYLSSRSRETVPNSGINCNRMRQFIIYLAKRYRRQYAERHGYTAKEKTCSAKK